MIDLSLVTEKIMAVDIGLKGGIVMNNRNVLHVLEADKIELDKWIADADRIIAEDVHTMPGQGIHSAGVLLEQKGYLRGLAAAIRTPIQFIQPLKWIECYTMKRTKHFETKSGKKDKTGWKKHLLDLAREIASDQVRPLLNLKTADAFLMWNYEASKLTPNPLEKKTLQFNFSFPC
jgi:hypothetical protein